MASRWPCLLLEVHLKPTRVIAERLIEEWRKGERGKGFWKDEIPRSHLYAVRGYEHLLSGGWRDRDRSWATNRLWHRYRIQSSTQGGVPIEKLWNIEFQRIRDTWGVVRLAEAQ